MLSRLQAKDFLISLGVAEPTDTQISDYLNSVMGEVKKEKDRAEQYKKDSDKVAELQAKLDEINSQNLTDIEKANKATETANERIAELERQIKESNIRKGLAEKGIVGEDADKFVSGLMDGNFDAEAFGAIYENGKKSAIADFEKKALEDTPNPNGVGSDGKEPEKTEMDKAVELAAKSLGGADKSSADIINAYK